MQRLFRGLDLFPVAQHRRGRAFDCGIDIGLVAGGARGLFAKDVRMAANQLAVQVSSTSAMVKWPSLAAISA